VAHLWIEQEGEWTVLPLDGVAVNLGTQPLRYLEAESGPASVLIIPAARDKWVLVERAGYGAWANGLPLSAGMRVLADRDEIRINDAGRVFFSAETLARIEVFHVARERVFCGRCRQALQEGEQAVRCSGCGVWYHQTDKYPCWTYTETCAFCPHSTSLDAGYNWTPEG
jgi:hypothetical protein